MRIRIQSMDVCVFSLLNERMDANACVLIVRVTTCAGHCMEYTIDNKLWTRVYEKKSKKKKREKKSIKRNRLTYQFYDLKSIEIDVR